MSAAKWHSGPPPSVGWWPASMIKSEDSFRWWDGCNWSFSADQDASFEEVKRCAAKVARHQYLVQWQHRPASWPARSRT